MEKENKLEFCNHTRYADKYHDKNGLLHATGKPAYDSNLLKIWAVHGKRHRIGGPAYEGNNISCYYYNGKLHRVDGPAVIKTDCETKKVSYQYWITGIRVTKKQFNNKKHLMFLLISK